MKIKLTIEEMFLLLETYSLAIENNYARHVLFSLACVGACDGLRTDAQMQENTKCAAFQT